MLPAEVLAAADAALTAGEAARGLHLVDHLLRTFPGHLRARTLRAQVLLELGDEGGAAADAATVLSADLLNVDAMLVSARLAEASGDLHQSHALIGRAASIEPGHAGVRKAFADSVTMLPRDSAALGLSYLAHGWPDLAERELRAALARDSSRVDLRVGLAEALWQQARYEEARPECRTVLDHNPRCLRATLMMAHILAEQGRTAHGVEMLEQAGQLDPEFTIAAELYAKATLSRMSLPPAPSVPEPPPYVDESAVEAIAVADDDGVTEGADDGAVAGEEGIFTPVIDTDADATGEAAETRSDPAEVVATEDDVIAAGDVAADDGDEIEAGEAKVGEDDDSDESGESGDEEAVAMGDAEVVAEDWEEPGQGAPGAGVAFSAGWPAAGPDRGEPAVPVSESPSVEAEPAETDDRHGGVPVEEEAGESVGMPAEGVAGAPGDLDEPSDEAAEAVAAPESVVEPTSAGPEPAAATTEPEAEAVEPEPEAEAVTPEPEPEVATTEPEAEAIDLEAATAAPEPDPPDDDGRAALIGMARIGGWDSVIDTLAERLSGEDLGDVVATIEELDGIDGFPVEIWQLLGDHYMRNRRPQLASEAYFRAVRRTSE